MYRIRRFGVVRTATVVAVAYAIAIAILVIPFGLIAFVSAPRALGGTLTAALLIGLVVAVIIYPLLIWVITAIGCLVYNLAARWVGGIEVEIERRQQAWAQPPGSWPPAGPNAYPSQPGPVPSGPGPSGPPPGQGAYGSPPAGRPTDETPR